MRISDWSSDVCSSDLSAASARARLTAVVDLPTPPFPEPMAMMLRIRGSGLRLGCTAWAGMRGIADVLGFGEAWEKAGGFRMLRARGNHVNCMLMSSSGGRNIEAFQRNTLKPLGEIMRARSSGIKPNRLSVALFAALALRSEEH